MFFIQRLILKPPQQSAHCIMNIFHSDVLKAIRLVEWRRVTLFKKFLFAGGTIKIFCHHFLFLHFNIRSARLRASWPENSQNWNPNHCGKVHHPTIIAYEQTAFS